MTTELFEDLAMGGLATRVQSLEKMKSAMVAHPSGAKSRLLMVNVRWREPIADRKSIPVIAAHLHNNVAKKPGGNEYNEFLTSWQNSALAEVAFSDRI